MTGWPPVTLVGQVVTSLWSQWESTCGIGSLAG